MLSRLSLQQKKTTILMYERQLDLNFKSLHRVRFICHGDYKVGKSTFLRRFMNQTDQKVDSEGTCQLYVRIKTMEDKLLVGQELYELPSSSNLAEQTCYKDQEESCHGLVFFFQTSTKKLREHLSLWLRSFFQGREDKLWTIPIILVGLKKDKLTPMEFAQQRTRRVQQMAGIIDKDNILFFGMECGQHDFEGESEYFNRYLRIVSETQVYKYRGHRQFFLKPNLSTYWLLYSVTELAEIAGRHCICQIWKRIAFRNNTQYKY